MKYEGPLDHAGLLRDLRDAADCVAEAAALLRDLRRDATESLPAYTTEISALRERASALAEELQAVRRRIAGDRT